MKHPGNENMTNVIHMEIEQVRQAASQLSRAANQLETQADSISKIVRGIPWQGPIRDQFVGDFSMLMQKMLGMAEEGRMLGMRIQREADELQAADKQGAQEYDNISTDLSKWWEGIKNTWNTLFIREAAKMEFSEWWSEQTPEQRLDFLRQEHIRITNKYGFPAIELKVEDIPDPVGQDALGYNSGTSFTLDSDNLASDNPWDLLNTVAHESRHSYQRLIVEQVQLNGKVPEDFSQTQVDAWKSDLDNYITPENDFQAYRDQSIEKDARSFGQSYSDQALDNRDWVNINSNPS
jgi:hypothetical protein